MKTQGQTIKRTVCTLRLVYDDPQWDEQLTGFSSPAQAWAEAQKRIDYLLDLSGRIRQEYPWPRIRYDEDAA